MCGVCVVGDVEGGWVWFDVVGVVVVCGRW